MGKDIKTKINEWLEGSDRRHDDVIYYFHPETPHIDLFRDDPNDENKEIQWRFSVEETLEFFKEFSDKFCTWEYCRQSNCVEIDLLQEEK